MRIIQTIVFLEALLFAPLLAPADIVVVGDATSDISVNEGPYIKLNGMVGRTTTKIKGDLARMEGPRPSGAEGVNITFVDLAKEESFVPYLKRSFKVNINALMKRYYAPLLGRDFNAVATWPREVLKFESTGEHERVGDWDAEIFVAKLGETALKSWVVRDFPNATLIKPLFEKLDKATDPFDTWKSNLPGIVVKSETITPHGKMTNTMVSCKEIPLDESEFVIPPPYEDSPKGLFGQ